MFGTILIANRGEIACRIIDTCRRLGVRAVAVYSEADRHARHVRLADAAAPIGPAAPAESYLSIERILAAAREHGAEAVHPGYGFLSENADFARACEDAGLAFIGPRTETIAAMGSKSESKRLMDEAGVPTVPGYHGAEQDDERLTAEAERIGYPLMIKPVAGGGGKGMRVVREPGALAEALDGARREARGAFGDDTLLLERYLDSPRHIEMQVFGDGAGDAVHLFERECSIQRRYQKIIEESPSPALDASLRERMAESAVAAARAMRYRGAGTVELIMEASGAFYFMEMNTRLQVEHPVTEAITGRDLVAWQLSLAAGEGMPAGQSEIHGAGHAIEARLYAESPEQGFMPSGGRIERLCLPAGEDIRVDTGVETGDTVSLHYDPMIAKLIVTAGDREACVARLREALAETAVFGPASNAAFLAAVAALPAFERGEIDTGFVDAHLDALLPSGETPSATVWAAAAAALLADQADDAAALAAARPDPGSPWYLRDAWQLGGQSHQVFYLADGTGAEHRLLARPRRRGWLLESEGTAPTALDDIERDGCWLHYRADGVLRSAAVLREGRELVITVDGVRARLAVADGAHGAGPAEEESRLVAPMPGRVVRVHCAAGDRVSADAALIVLEAMKMEYTIRAPADGTVSEVLFAEGDVVDADEALVAFEPDGAGSAPGGTGG